MHVEGLRPVDSDVTELLHTEHAVARVLAGAPDEAEAYPELLAAMGEALAWDFGAVWVPVADDALRCAATWPQGAEFAAESRALTLADRGYVLDMGRNAHEGTGSDLLVDTRVAELYLGSMTAAPRTNGG